jgi:desulfoferrodoxin (superoxide reductase-like protein)
MTNGVGWHINSEQSAKYLYEHVLRRLSEGREVFLSEKEGTRTTDQNSALHAVLRRLAEALNDAGQEMAHPFNPEFHIPWSEVSVKELLLRPIAIAKYDKASTTRLTRKELSEAVEILLGRIAELTGVTVDGLEGPR